MSNVIQLSFANRSPSASDFSDQLAQALVHKRRVQGDVMWLKENAEFLSIMETTGQSFDISIYSDFYETIERQLSFFPQYYRFYLGMALDLDALGYTSSKGEQMAHWVNEAGLIKGEMSDVQRAEGARLLKRADIELPEFDHLDRRLRQYMDHSQTFAVPNKKASYELTHLVFYLSEYGRKDPQLSPNAKTSLQYVGLLALLDTNADLLSEVCIAMRFAGLTPPSAWEEWIADIRARFTLESAGSEGDDYHQYMMTQWCHMIGTGQGFEGPFAQDVHSFVPPLQYVSPLRQMSEALFDMDQHRSDDWYKMQGKMTVDLTEPAYEILELAIETSPVFDDFFGHFARCNTLMTATS